jgi:hypothetical protein
VGSRFLEVDPVEGGLANDYDYVHGDPINKLDSDGRLADSCVAFYGASDAGRDTGTTPTAALPTSGGWSAWRRAPTG